MVTANELIDHARTYLGVPFLHQGRSREGIDCVGLCICTCIDLQIIPDTYTYTNYGRYNNPIILLTELDKMCTRISLRDKQLGDILVFSLPYYPCHIAFLSHNNRIIHASNNVKRVTEQYMDLKWESRLRFCYRIGEVDPCN